jgi:alpha/beta superfamily hydrolase
VPLRDGVTLLADVHRPAEPGRYPVLVAASPYPRQIQNLGAPAGFIEAGASDFIVPRGYVHVIANCRGTSGSGSTFGFFDGQERRDMYDLVEWAAQQSWSNGNVGMVGISYFACTQMEAAVERPPHLKAIMPIAGTYDLYESATHHGLMSSSFVTPFLYMIGMTSGHTNKLWRSKLMDAVGDRLLTPAIHKKFEMANGEEDALLNALPVKNVLRPPISRTRNDTKHILDAECDARPVMGFDLRHGNQEIGFHYSAGEPEVRHRRIVRAEWSADQFVAIQIYEALTWSWFLRNSIASCGMSRPTRTHFRTSEPHSFA